MSDSAPPPLWHRTHARWWYIWGLSLCYRGNRSHEQSDYRAGIESFSRALRVWPGYAPALYRRGVIRGRELGEHRAAIADLTRASEIRPDWADPYLQRGLFQRFHGDPHDAIADLERYIALAETGYWCDEARRLITMLRAEI
jgi:tetratricopeptide (TPR) repeat protein